MLYGCLIVQRVVVQNKRSPGQNVTIQGELLGLTPTLLSRVLRKQSAAALWSNLSMYFDAVAADARST
jgi:hypothetical protein